MNSKDRTMLENEAAFQLFNAQDRWLALKEETSKRDASLSVVKTLEGQYNNRKIRYLHTLEVYEKLSLGGTMDNSLIESRALSMLNSQTHLVELNGARFTSLPVKIYRSL